MTAYARSWSGGFPFIARVAGLPALTLEPFRSDLGDGALQRLREFEERLADARAHLVETLYHLVHAADPARRRFLLAVKRDTFNGRSLARHRGHHQWFDLAAAAPGVDEVLRLEVAIADWMGEFDDAYRNERNRQRRHLAGFFNRPELLRGMALSSVVLVENLPRLTRDPDSFGRRERRLEESLLRYLSRTAVKLSPFSSLTRVGLGLVQTSPGTPEFQLLEGGWRERSLVCLRRYLLDLYSEILARHPPFRDGLRVVVNDTVEHLAGEQIRFLRAGYWEYLPDTRELKHQRPALVKVRLAGPVARWLSAEAAERRTYGQLLAALPPAFPETEPASLRATLDKLLEIGFLCFVWPWANDALHLEKEMLGRLEALPTDAAMTPFIDLLRHLVSLLEGYAGSAAPGEVAAEGQSVVRQILRSVAPLAGMSPDVTLPGNDHYFQEDVFLVTSSPAIPAGEVARLSVERARQILNHVDPLARISNLDNTRHDFLHTLAAFASERWPDQAEVGFLDLFDSAHKLFQEYVKFEVAARSYLPLRTPAFNPLGLETVERIKDWRLQVADTLESLVVPDGEVLRFDHDAAGRILDEIPPPYADSRDFSAFVQPLDADGSRWALNSLFEGAGRLSSRYTAAMAPAMRDAWTAHFTERSTFLSGGESVELVDLFCPAGHTLNVHAAQTRRVLEVSSESSSLPPERRLGLRDLRVRLRGPDGLPQLTDREGRRILPLHLGGLVFRFMPHLLKFLILFGPGEFRFCIPRCRSRREGDVQVVDRHWAGNVLYRRKTWVVEATSLRSPFAGSSEAAVFLAVNRWRRDRGIPERVFAVEPLVGGVERPQTKPQYIDFSSPLFLEVLRSIAEVDVPRFSFMEALPLYSEFPQTESGQQWGVELQLDSFGLMATETLTKPPNGGPSLNSEESTHGPEERSVG
jgi:hypothetical protein